ncbi:uncharacterized protein LOC110115017 isoform X2 [Dendrobium catenatum]|uniref:uncharacterized protein LOC110115017 isoform X2 n=1 Tax=Dendrobium catenatum TaxID=906689 RepID=UPI0010A0414D|nr:uncharacterized protein LOC110115017 isoform X2 [Dendrobium catenatum]
MGDEIDPQKMKRIAAAAYDYELDPRWTEYWSNVLIPPHMASRSDVVDHYKRKFYQRYIDPDFVVQSMSSSISSQAPGAFQGSSSVPATENERPRNSGSSSGTNVPQGRTSSFFQMDERTVNFAFKFWIPRTWNQPGIQTWLQSVMVAREFINLPYSIVFVTSGTPFKLALIPVLSWSVQHVTKFLRRNFKHSILYRKYLDKTCRWVDVNITTIRILSSNAEVALGFLFIISLFSQRRSIIHTFMYWQLLKLMYNVPATCSYHQTVWSTIDRTITPFINRYAPFLNTPISIIKKWWLR